MFPYMSLDIKNSWNEFANVNPNQARLHGLPLAIGLTCIGVYYVSKECFKSIGAASANLAAFAFNDKYSFKLGIESAISASVFALCVPAYIALSPFMAVICTVVIAFEPKCGI